MNLYEQLQAKIGEATAEHAVASFCLESNRIEGEARAEYNDIAATMLILTADKITEQVLFDAHTDFSVGSGLSNNERGAYRTVQVYVGKYVPPNASQVPKLMQDFLLHYNIPRFSNSFNSHVQFEKIHPFVDFNGRMGRALWLRKALEEGYDLSLLFLHKFYYQTLTHFE